MATGAYDNGNQSAYPLTKMNGRTDPFWGRQLDLFYTMEVCGSHLVAYNFLMR